MNIFSVIELNGRNYFLTDEQAKYVLKESVYHGKTSKFIVYYNPYLGIDDQPLERFKRVNSTEPYEYELDPNGEYILNKEGEYINPLEGQIRYTRDAMYVKEPDGEYVYNATRGTFVNPYTGVTRYRREGEVTFEIAEDGEFLYDPLLEHNNGFYRPYMDKVDNTVMLTRYTKVPVPGGEPAYVESSTGEYLYDEEDKIYYNPYYDKDDQTILLTRYNVGSELIYIEDENGTYIEGVDPDGKPFHYDPYDGVDRFKPSEELSTYYEKEDGEYITKPPFDIHERPNFGFYNEFPEWDMDKEVFDLGQNRIFDKVEQGEDEPDYIYEANIDDSLLEIGSIDRLNGQPLVDERKARASEYVRLSGGQRYSITNDNDYWMQIFEYKYDLVLQDYVFIRSYKVTYGALFRLHNLTTHVKFAAGDPETTDLSNVKIKMVTDPNATGYVFTGPVYETFNEAYQAGYYYFFDCSDRTQFCKLVGDGTDCQAYERYQMSTKILKQVSEIEDATNKALSRISQTGAEILLEVGSTEKNMKSYIQQQMNQILLEVNEQDNGLRTKIQMAADAITAMATSEYTILKREYITPDELEYSNQNPDNFTFSDVVPTIQGDTFALDPNRQIKSNYIAAYEADYVYFNPGYTFVPDENGEYVLNGTYYKPYEEEIKAGRHRYVQVPNEDPDEVTYEIDDENGTYILVGADYIDPYATYPRYQRFATFCRLVYNDVEGYGYDIYTSSNFALRSFIEQTASQIRLEVSDTSGALVSRIIQTSDAITMDVADFKKDTAAKFKQTADSISAAVSSGGSIVVESDPSLLENAVQFYSTRPELENNSFVFNPDYMRTFDDYKAAYEKEYIYFTHNGVYVESANGNFIKDDGGNYVDPYAGVTRYVRFVNSGKDKEEISYAANANGRYIKNEDGTYGDPYVGKTRYIREPAYCEVVKNGETYTANVLISATHKNQTEFEMTSNQIKLGVTDTSGNASSIQQTAGSIRSEVKEANAAMSSSINQQADEIEMAVQSKVFKVEEKVDNEIPISITASANIWYRIPPAYNETTGRLEFSTTYRKGFNSHSLAYAAGYIYLDAGMKYIEDPNGRYIESEPGVYINPYEGVDRYSRYTDAANGGAYVYELDPHGRYILDEVSEEYHDPYGMTRAIKRYEPYACYYKLTRDDYGIFTLTMYAFTNQKTSNTILQTAEMTKLTVSDEMSGRKSQISQTAEEIRMSVENTEQNLSTDIRQTADKLEAIARSGGELTVGRYSQIGSSVASEYYSVQPDFDQENEEFHFDNDYKYTVEPVDPKLAFDEGYRYFANNQNEYVPDGNGDYIHVDGRTDAYYNPYQGATRYVRTLYDYDSEGAPSDKYTYDEDPNGRYLYDDVKGFYDPYVDDEGNAKQRFIKVTANRTYCEMTNIERTAIDFRYSVPSGVIPAGVLYFLIDGKIHKLETNQHMYEGFVVIYTIATGNISYYAGNTLYQSFNVGDYEVVDTLPDGATLYEGFTTTYNDVYYWNTYASIADVNKSSVKLTSKSLETAVTDAAGYGSQIRQTATGITSIVKGAPVEIDSVEGSKALEVLRSVDKFYPVIPSFNNANKLFEFQPDDPVCEVDGETVTLETAFNRNYRFFTATEYHYLKEDTGEYIREKIIKDPVYRYFDPREDESYGPTYIKYGEGDSAVYVASTEEDAIYFYDEEGDRYYSPWLEAGAHRYVLDNAGAFEDYHTHIKYTMDPTGMYLREEVILPDEFKIYRPFYQDDNTTKLPRYAKVYEPQEEGSAIDPTSLLCDAEKDETDPTRFYDPYAGQQRYSWEYRKVTDGRKNTGFYLRELVSTEPEVYRYYRPYYDADNKTAVNRYKEVIEFDEGEPLKPWYSKADEAHCVDLVDGEFKDYKYIINGSDEYIDPFEGQDLYEKVVYPDDNGAYIEVSAQDETHPNMIEIINPFEDRIAYKLIYKEDPNGRYIYKHSERSYIDPYDEITDRYTPYSVYCKFFYDGHNYTVKYYSRVNDLAISKIDQTADAINMSVSDGNAGTYTNFNITKEEIGMSLKNVETKMETELSVKYNQIREHVADGQNKIRAEITINADSIENVVSGSFIKRESGTTVVTDPITLYNEVPLWDKDNKRFVAKGYKKENITGAAVGSAIAGGYKYQVYTPGAVGNVREHYCACLPSETNLYIDEDGNIATLPEGTQRYSMRFGEMTDIATEIETTTAQKLSAPRYVTVAERHTGYIINVWDFARTDLYWYSTKLGKRISFWHRFFSEKIDGVDNPEWSIFAPFRTWYNHLHGLYHRLDRWGRIVPYLRPIVRFTRYDYVTYSVKELPRYIYTTTETETRDLEVTFEGCEFSPDPNGSYIKVGDDYLLVESWVKPVPGYYRYTSYSETTASWDFFIRAEDDYESRISQTANSISLSVENEDRGTMAEIAMTNNEIRQTVEDKESQLRSEIVQNSDAIDMTVSGSNAKVKSGSSEYTGIVYNRVPKWNGSAFEFLGKDNESEPESMPISADALTAGYRYSAGTMDVACGPADSVEAKVGPIWYTRGTGTGTYSAIYRKTYTLETYTDSGRTLKRTKEGYEIDPNGSYIKVGDDYLLVESWVKPVPGYYRYTSYSETTASWDFFIRAEDDYESRISQTANSISLSVENEDRGTKSLLAITENGIESVVTSAYKNVQTTQVDELTDTYLYKGIPVYKNRTFEYKDSSDMRLVSTADPSALREGYQYLITSAMIPCGPAIATHYRRSSGAFTAVTTKYKCVTNNIPTNKDYLIASTVNSAQTTRYVEDPNGEYVNISGTYTKVEFYHSVSAYCEYSVDDDGNIWMTKYISPEADYESKITQESTSITFSISGQYDSEVKAALGLWVDSSDKGHISITGDYFSVNATNFKLHENGTVSMYNGSIYDLHVLGTLYFGSGTTYYISTGSGSTGTYTKPYYLNLPGMYSNASSTYFSGQLVSPSGTIGGWRITSNKICSVDDYYDSMWYYNDPRCFVLTTGNTADNVFTINNGSTLSSINLKLYSGAVKMNGTIVKTVPLSAWIGRTATINIPISLPMPYKSLDPITSADVKLQNFAGGAISSDKATLVVNSVTSTNVNVTITDLTSSAIIIGFLNSIFRFGLQVAVSFSAQTRRFFIDDTGGLYAFAPIMYGALLYSPVTDVLSALSGIVTPVIQSSQLVSSGNIQIGYTHGSSTYPSLVGGLLDEENSIYGTLIGNSTDVTQIQGNTINILGGPSSAMKKVIGFGPYFKDTDGNTVNGVILADTDVPFAVAGTAVASVASDSDRRLKTNISLLTPMYDKLFDMLIPTSFNYTKSTIHNTNETHIGLVAQDLEKALKELGFNDDAMAMLVKLKTGYLAINYTELIGLLIHQVQKLKKNQLRLEGIITKLTNGG